MNIRNKLSGITLLEIIIYTAISSIVLVFILRFMWNIFGTQARIEASAELTQNGRIILEKITGDFHNAEDFLPASVFDSNPGTLAINTAGSTTVIYDTYLKSVMIGGQTVATKKLRRKVGAADPLDLTTDGINVTNFQIQNRTRSSASKNIRIELSLEYLNPGGDPDREKELTFETAISSRIR